MNHAEAEPFVFLPPVVIAHKNQLMLSFDAHVGYKIPESRNSSRSEV